ncbi:hypothetical protein GYMLUDRAFT_120880, partial [Collybiopsis luxurians FD-317 M1]
QIAEKDLADYESEIHSLQIRIAQVRARHENLKAYTTNLGSLLSPIRRLPNELLGKIFGFASNPNDLTSRLRGSSASAVSSVCARWRQLALNSPEVWSSMRIYLCDKDDYEAEPDAILTETVLLFLQRSKNYPLSL